MSDINNIWIDECGRFAGVCIQDKSAVIDSCFDVLTRLPADGTVLVIGGGAGNVLFALAKRFSSLKFEVLGTPFPIAVLLRHQLKREQLDERVRVLDMDISDYHNKGRFDAALSLLGFKYVMSGEELDSLFSNLIMLMKPKARLLVFDMYYPEEDNSRDIFQAWKDLVTAAGMDDDLAEELLCHIKSRKSVLCESQIENLLGRNGLADVTRIFRYCFYGIWVAVVA